MNSNKSNIKADSLNNASEWKAPSGEEIRMALSIAGLTGVEFSKRINVKDRTVRRWVSGELYIPYAAWCILCLEANLGIIWK